MTKVFTYMNFYTVDMNYLCNDIYTYYVELYIPTVLSPAKQTVSGHSCVCSSTCTYQYTNYCNSNQNFYLQYPEGQILAYWDIGSNIIYVMMKHINQFILWSLKSTMKYNDVQQFLHLWNFLMTNDIKTCNNFLEINELISVMRYIYQTLTCSFSFFFCCVIHNFLHAKDYRKWYNSKHIFLFYINNYRYHHTIICCIHVEDVISTSSNYLLR